MPEVLLEIENLKMHFPIYKGALFRKEVNRVKAVDGLTFNIYKGETLGLVGESGCGKSTTGRAIIQLYRPTEGKVKLRGQNLCELSKKELHPFRRDLQMIFQDPYASLNPRMTVGDTIGEPLKVHKLASGDGLRRKVQDLMDTVGLDPRFIRRYPHEFSGGQRQRIGIARALASEPSFIVCDEPISALDVSIQAQVINLLEDLQSEMGLTYLFIAHDLAAVRQISDRIAVMYLGNLAELANGQDIYDRPVHPYTQALISAVPIPDPEIESKRERIVLTGDVPSPLNPPSGCVFHTRCPFAYERCAKEVPEFVEVGDDHYVACHLTEDEHRRDKTPNAANAAEARAAVKAMRKAWGIDPGEDASEEEE